MAEYLIQDTTLTAIANAVRAKTKKSDAILVSNLAEEIASISTGVELNFEVIGGTSQPSSPKENTIWVNTSTPITNWMFSSTEPDSAEAGMVWIAVGTESDIEFNALKKNAIQVYPEKAQQYVNGAWVKVSAMTYQGGKWNEWIVDTIILDASTLTADEAKAMFVGWSNYNNITKENDYIVLPHKSTDLGEYLIFVINTQYDITDYTHLVVEGYATSTNCKFGVKTNNSSSYLKPCAAQQTFSTSLSELSLKIDGLSGKHYIAFPVRMGGQKVYLKSVKLRKE